MFLVSTAILSVDSGHPLVAGFLLSICLRLPSSPEPEDGDSEQESGTPPCQDSCNEGQTALSRTLLTGACVIAGGLNAPFTSGLLAVAMMSIGNVPELEDGASHPETEAPPCEDSFDEGSTALSRTLLTGASILAGSLGAVFTSGLLAVALMQIGNSPDQDTFDEAPPDPETTSIVVLDLEETGHVAMGKTLLATGAVLACDLGAPFLSALLIASLVLISDERERSSSDQDVNSDTADRTDDFLPVPTHL